MLETIRQYAWEKLVDDGEADELRRRHFDYFCALGREAQPYLCGPRKRDWSARLDPERANLRAAITTGMATGQLSAALQLAWDTFVYYYIRDAFQEPRQWVQDIAANRDRLDEVDRAKLDVTLAIAGRSDSDARENLTAAAHVMEDSGLELERAVTYWYLGLAYWNADDATAAIEALRTSSRAYAALAHDWGVATAETTLGALQTAVGAHDVAAAHHRRALEHARAIDNRPLVIQALQGLALLAALADRTPDAVTLLAEASRIADPSNGRREPHTASTRSPY